MLLGGARHLYSTPIRDNSYKLNFIIAESATVMDRLESLRALIDVAERHSFSAAARARRTSTAAMSRAIAALEQDLGVALLRRTTRHVSLTPEGAAFLEECRGAIEKLDDAARVIRGGNAEPRGLLVVSAPVVFGRMHVLPIIAELMNACRELRVELILTDRFVRFADEGVDVGVRIAELIDSSLLSVRVAETRRILVASPDYLATRGTPRTLAAVADHELIAFDAFAPNGEWRFGPRSAVRFEPRLLTNNVEAAIDAATAGLGIARVFCYQVREHITAGRLTEVLIEHEPAPVPISLLFQANRQGSPNVRAFIDATKSGLRQRLR
jgi:DNA-binding transcriptional LysR family regulator